MDEKILNNIKGLTDKRNLDAIIKESLKEICLCKKSIWQYLVATVLGLIISFAIGFSCRTVNVITEISELLFNTSIGVIGIILGAYSIFQALMKKELIWILIKSDENLLKQSNKTFINLIILNVINALVSLTLRIILYSIGKEFLVFDSMQLNNLVSTGLVLIYIVYNLLLILELIVFSINIYRMFCVYNTIEAIEAAKHEEYF